MIGFLKVLLRPFFWAFKFFFFMLKMAGYLVAIGAVLFIMKKCFYVDIPFVEKTQALTKPSYKAKYVRAYDADTITLNLACDFRLACDKIGVRVYGIDTPELRSHNKCEKKKAYEARDFVRRKLGSAKTIELQDLRRGKYFRIVAKVIVDGQDLSQTLVRQGYAVPYFGKTKPRVNWCVK